MKAGVAPFGSHRRISLDTVRDALVRIKSITWGYDDSRDHHFAALMGEFLEGSQRFSRKIGQKGIFPFFDLCKHAGAASALSREVVEDYEAWAEQQIASRLALFVCLWYLQACQAAQELAELGIDGPGFYEPLMKIMDEGGNFRVESGLVFVGRTGVPMRDHIKKM